MTTLRIVLMERLRARLGDILGSEDLLFHRFDRALAAHDADALDAAMTVLDLYPLPIRTAVQDAVAAWLFGDGALPPLADAARDPRQGPRAG